MKLREKIKAIWLGIQSDWHPAVTEQRVENARKSCTRLKALKPPSADLSRREQVKPTPLNSQSSGCSPDALEPLLKSKSNMPSEGDLVELSKKLDTALKAAAKCPAKMSHYRLAAYVQSLPAANDAGGGGA